MIRKQFLFLLFIIISLYSLELRSQNDSITDISYYFDDGGISEAKNIIKINALAIVNGDLPFSLEKTISEAFGIEIGFGILLPYYVPEIPKLLTNDIDIVDPGYGYSLLVNPRFYLQHKAPEFNYWGIQYRRRNYNLNDGNIIYNNLTINFGLQLSFGKRFLFDYNIGAGIEFKEGDKTRSSNYISHFAFPISIKLGYIL